MSEELFCVCTYCISFCKAFSAIVVFALHGSKGNRILFAAIGADDSGSLSLRSAGVLACLSASLATLRLIYKAFLSVEFLLSCGKNEFFAAILANECLVFVHEIYLSSKNYPVRNCTAKLYRDRYHGFWESTSKSGEN